jgi:hypothetical protein
MASKTVTSPAGETIEIVPDVDWCELTGTTDHALRMWNAGAKRFLVGELWLGGESADPKSGRATTLLHARMRERFGDEIKSQPNSITMMMSDYLNAPAFERKTNGKRTQLIRLIALPELWYGKLMANLDEWEDTSPIDPDPIPEPPPGDREAAELMEPIILGSTQTDESFEEMIRDMELDAPTIYADEKPPLEISIASQVAMSLLTTVVEIISAGSGAAVDEKVRALTGDLEDVMGKLGARLEENDRLRRQLRQAGDEITALRHERDGLRSRLRSTEANLTAALKGDAVQAINGEIMRRVDAIMRVAPKGKGE